MILSTSPYLHHDLPNPSYLLCFSPYRTNHYYKKETCTSNSLRSHSISKIFWHVDLPNSRNLSTSMHTRISSTQDTFPQGKIAFTPSFHSLLSPSQAPIHIASPYSTLTSLSHSSLLTSPPLIPHNHPHQTNSNHNTQRYIPEPPESPPKLQSPRKSNERSCQNKKKSKFLTNPKCNRKAICCLRRYFGTTVEV